MPEGDSCESFMCRVIVQVTQHRKKVGKQQLSLFPHKRLEFPHTSNAKLLALLFVLPQREHCATDTVTSVKGGFDLDTSQKRGEEKRKLCQLQTSLLTVNCHKQDVISLKGFVFSNPADQHFLSSGGINALPKRRRTCESALET